MVDGKYTGDHIVQGTHAVAAEANRIEIARGIVNKKFLLKETVKVVIEAPAKQV